MINNLFYCPLIYTDIQISFRLYCISVKAYNIECILYKIIYLYIKQNVPD